MAIISCKGQPSRDQLTVSTSQWLEAADTGDEYVLHLGDDDILSSRFVNSFVEEGATCLIVLLSHHQSVLSAHQQLILQLTANNTCHNTVTDYWVVPCL